MRIAVVGTICSSMISFRGPLLRELVEAGHEVFAFAVDYDQPAMEEVRALGAVPVPYELDRTGVNPVRDLRSMFQLRRLFREYRIELVFTYFAKPVIFGTLAARLAGILDRFALLPGLGYAFTESGQGSGLKQRLLKSVLLGLFRLSLRSNRVVFVYNEDDQQELLKYRLVRKDNLVRVNGTGIDLDRYSFSDPCIEPATFLLAARLLVEKGIREYLAAARKVRERYPDVRFILLGGEDSSPGGISAEEVQGAVRDGVVEWPGKVPDILPWLEQASVYVLPSYREGAPRSNQEAMAKGRAIITTDAPGCRQTVMDGETGYLVPVRDVEALADRMKWFVENPDRIVAMGCASRRLAEERFDVREINRKLMGAMGLHGES